MKAVLLWLSWMPTVLLAQIGGVNSFQSLRLVNNARAAGLGGTAVSLADGDITQFFNNPATLDSVDEYSAAFMINPYFDDINFYSAATTFGIKKLKMGVGINYLNYGEFVLTDPSGLELGTFRANDYQLLVSTSHRVGPIALGVNAKFVQSSIESYSSSALAMDIGGTFHIKPNWKVAMVFENFGFVLSDYALTNQEMPFDVRIGTTFKPTYMPFRFTLTTQSLLNSNVFDEETEDEGRSNSFLDEAFRSVVLGTEIVFSENFQVLVGYNHKRKQELKLENAGGTSGLTYGFLLRISKFYFRYSRMTYHAAGGTSLISVQTNFNDFKKIL